MRIYIIRHGETDYNAQGRLQGQLNIPLNANGFKLAFVTGQALQKEHVHFDVCYASPSVRAKETAWLVLYCSGNLETPVYEDQRLLEMSFGTSDGLCCVGKNYELQMPKETFDLLLKDAFRFPGFEQGETVLELCKRAQEFMQKLAVNPDLQDKTVLISTHGCTVRALLQHVYGKHHDFWHGKVPDNCAINIIDYRDGQWTLVADDKIYYDAGLCENKYK